MCLTVEFLADIFALDLLNAWLMCCAVGFLFTPGDCCGCSGAAGAACPAMCIGGSAGLPASYTLTLPNANWLACCSGLPATVVVSRVASSCDYTYVLDPNPCGGTATMQFNLTISGSGNNALANLLITENKSIGGGSGQSNWSATLCSGCNTGSGTVNCGTFSGNLSYTSGAGFVTDCLDTTATIGMS